MQAVCYQTDVPLYSSRNCWQKLPDKLRTYSIFMALEKYIVYDSRHS